MRNVRNSQIDNDNQKLIDRMSCIFRSPRKNQLRAPSQKSLNYDKRKQELTRINSENQHLLNLLTKVKSEYQHSEYKKFQRNSRKYRKIFSGRSNAIQHSLISDGQGRSHTPIIKKIPSFRRSVQGLKHNASSDNLYKKFI